MTCVSIATLAGVARAGVAITSPAPGTTWNAGEIVTVTWTKTFDVPDSAVIGLTMSRGGDGPGVIVLFFSQLYGNLFVAGDGAATFRLPDWVGDANDYTLTLSTVLTNAVPVEDSVSPISVTGSGSLRRLELDRAPSPRPWVGGHRQRVNFQATGIDGPIDVSLASLDRMWSFSTRTAATDGFALVDLPAEMPTGAFFLQIAANRGLNRDVHRVFPFDRMLIPHIEGMSQPFFIEVSAPDPAVVWTAGQSREVCWSTSFSSGRTSVVLGQIYRRSGVAAGAFSSTINGCATLTPCPFVGGEDFVLSLSIQPDSGGTYRYQFPYGYNIQSISSPPVLELTSPLDGPTYQTGDAITLTWNSEGFGNNASVVVFPTVENAETVFSSNATFGEPVGSGMNDWTAFQLLSGIMEYVPQICAFEIAWCPMICDFAEQPMTILPPMNPPVFGVDFSPLRDVYADDDYVQFTYFASGAAGMKVELLLLDESGVGSVIGRSDAVEGIGNVGGSLDSSSLASRKSRFEVRLVNDGAAWTRIQSDSFVYVVGPPTCGDVVQDSNVDHADWVEMSTCMALSPLLPPGFPPIVDVCRVADLNGDEFIDMRDQQIFQNLFGVGTPRVPPNCPIEP